MTAFGIFLLVVAAVFGVGSACYAAYRSREERSRRTEALKKLRQGEEQYDDGKVVEALRSLAASDYARDERLRGRVRGHLRRLANTKTVAESPRREHSHGDGAADTEAGREADQPPESVGSQPAQLAAQEHAHPREQGARAVGAPQEEGDSGAEDAQDQPQTGSTEVAQSGPEPPSTEGVVASGEAALSRRGGRRPPRSGWEPALQVYDPPEEFAKNANIQDPEIWDKAAEDYEAFWESWARELHWFAEWDQVCEWDPPFTQWFVGGQLNPAYNCLDYQIEQGRGDKQALIWVGNEPDQQQTYTYSELLTEVNKFANVLKAFGIQKGDPVNIYLPMIPELPIAMLACARIGAVHSVVFSAFQPGQLAERIYNVESKVLVTADQSPRGGQITPLKENSDEALQDTSTIENVIVVRRTGDDVPMEEGRDQYWDELMENASDECEAEQMDAEDPFFVLYSSGSTGRPKGIVHTIGGYLTQLKMTMEWVFDRKEGDVFWCTADIGWITGHSYGVYGPLLCGETNLEFEGTPSYPDHTRWPSVIEEHGVTILYTAPTAIRAFMKQGIEPLEGSDLSSLRLLGSVGEPINPKAWVWYYENFGGGRCPIVDTWWQTETGAIMIAPLPGITKLKPGSPTKPLPGIFPGLWDEEEEQFVEGPGSGALTINKPWPSQLRTLWQDPERYKEEYFSKISKDVYYVEDGAERDEEGYYTITGRIDAVLNVSGHRLSTVEIENALLGHEGVAEAAVVGIEDEDKGQAPVAFVIPEGSQGEYDEDFEKQLIDAVAEKTGNISRPDRIYFVEDLPKTNSGKIMSRLLQNIAQGEELGDTSTLFDPPIVDALEEETRNQEGPR